MNQKAEFKRWKDHLPKKEQADFTTAFDEENDTLSKEQEAKKYLL